MNKKMLVLLFLTAAIPLFMFVLYVTPKHISFGQIQQTQNVPGSVKSIPTMPVDDVERLNLQNLLQKELAAMGASYNVSLYYKNLNSGYEVLIDPDRSWNPASTVKAFVVVEAFRQRDVGLINFDSRVTIKDGNVVPTELEAHEYQPLRAGVKATIRELIYAMIVQSDNTAFNTLLDVLDRRNITASLRRLGFVNTIVGEKLSLSSDQYQIDSSVFGRQTNQTTVHDFGHLFDLLYEGKIVDSEEILTIFKQQKINDAIPALLPQDIEIAHKTGTLPPYYHDGGIIYKPDDPFILVVFTNTGGTDAIARLAKVSYYKSRDVLGASNATITGKIINFIFSLKHIFLF